MDCYFAFGTLISFLVSSALGVNCCEGSDSSNTDNEELVNLCIMIVTMFVTLIAVLSIFGLLFWDYALRTQRNRLVQIRSRNTLSTEALPGDLYEREIEEWGSALSTLPGAAAALPLKVPDLKKYNSSTQTEHLLIETLVASERPPHLLPPIQRSDRIH